MTTKKEAMNKLIKEVMSSVPIVATIPGSRNDAINIMVRNKVTGIPVVRESDGQLMGVVSRKDVFQHMEEDQLSLIMKKNPMTISPNAKLSEAAKIFAEKRIHRLPVVDNGILVGIVTPTDLIRVIRHMDTPLTAEDAVRTKCVTCYEKDPLSYIVASMKICDVSALPVLDSKGKLTGIITDRDLFVDQTKDVSVIEEMGLDTTCKDLAGYRNVLPLFYMATHSDELSESHVVNTHMVREPITAFKKTPLKEVAKTMDINDFGQIPIHGDRDELIGMVYDVDVLIALIGDEE